MTKQAMISALAILYGVMGLAGAQLWHFSYSQPGMLWLNAGVGLLLLQHTGRWRYSALFAAAMVSYLGLFTFQGMSLVHTLIAAFIFSCFDVILIVLAFFALTKLKGALSHPLFSQSDDIARYFVIVCLFPAIVVNAIKIALWGLFSSNIDVIMILWSALGDIAGLLLFLPLAYWKKRKEESNIYMRHLISAAVLLSFPILASIYSQLSLVFLSFPLALVIAIRLGFNGASFTALTLAIVATVSFCLTPEASPFSNLVDIWIYVIAFSLTAHFVSQAVIELRQNKASLQRLVENRTEALRQTNQQLEHLATTDELTGAVNRRHFQQLANYAITAACRYHEPLSILALDIDHFKRINDNYGHDVGDNALKHFAGICKLMLRSSDTFARIGGEEFVILLPRTRFLAAKLVAEKICTSVSESLFTTHSKTNLKFTVSIGVAEWHAEENNIAATLKRADNALYEAKAAGRNRVVLSRPLTLVNE